LSTLKVVSKKIEPPPALEIQGLKAVSINTFCPIGRKFIYVGDESETRKGRTYLTLKKYV
jgi:hypothetical protein